MFIKTFILKLRLLKIFMDANESNTAVNATYFVLGQESPAKNYCAIAKGEEELIRIKKRLSKLNSCSVFSVQAFRVEVPIP